MPATDTGSQLYRAILADPACDTARLVFADFLDETGDHARAEFVRVQVELARIEGDCCERCKPGLVRENPTNSVCRRGWAELAERERELWSRVYDQFDVLPAVQSDANAIWMTTLDHIVAAHPNPPTWREAIVRRGFVDEIRCPAATFLGGECGCVQGCRYGPVVHAIDCKCCPACDGTGRTPGVAAELFARHPIERVTFQEKDPLWGGEEGDAYHWLRATPGPQMRWEVPVEPWDDALDGRFDTLDGGFDTDNLALSALSDAAVAWARKRAGLPPIPECTPPHT